MAMLFHLIDPSSLRPYPFTVHAGRTCFAVPDGNKFAVRDSLDESALGRFEHVVSVDGRDTLTNLPASRKASGIISGNAYTCKGFRTGSDGVHEFVCGRLGEGRTTTERNGTASSAGLVGVAVYAERRVGGTVGSYLKKGGPMRDGSRDFNVITRNTGASGGIASMSFTGQSDDPMRSVTLCSASASSYDSATSSLAFVTGPTAGAVAGAFVQDRVTTTEWDRGALVDTDLVEYDTPEGWAARGVLFATPVPLPERSPWPADALTTRFADPQTL